MGLKDLFKERITLEILAGGHVLPEKELPVAVTNAILSPGKTRGYVQISVPFGKKKEWKLTSVEWEESSARSGGKAAVGAIAGTVVAGPLAGIAGAAIGGRKKDTSKAFITIVDKDGYDHELHIKCDQQLYTKLSNMKA